jgi:hypothetical protein
MINNVMSGGKYVQVSGGGTTYVSKSYNENPKMIGDMMYDIDSQCVKVYDGHNWVTLISPSVTVGLTAEAEMLLDWARKKRAEDFDREHLAQTNPAIKDLVNQIKEKEDQIKMVQTLLKSSGTEGQELMGS